MDPCNQSKSYKNFAEREISVNVILSQIDVITWQFSRDRLVGSRNFARVITYNNSYLIARNRVSYVTSQVFELSAWNDLRPSEMLPLLPATHSVVEILCKKFHCTDTEVSRFPRCQRWKEKKKKFDRERKRGRGMNRIALLLLLSMSIV